ncbi:MAG: hypothetical protein IT294_00325 [Deltaproteobacteria bacterium]|nr:hypothetical protein [Deltaproteobacteria bacterium]
MSAEDLAVRKIAFNRDKDWIDLREMLAIRGDAFDGKYVLGWLGEILGPDDLRDARFDFCRGGSAAPLGANDPRFGRRGTTRNGVGVR